jgi:hypothetical protein
MQLPKSKITGRKNPPKVPTEYMLLKDQPVPRKECPMCGAEPFVPFLRGMIHRARHTFWLLRPQPYCALICETCKSVVAWETPPEL